MPSLNLPGDLSLEAGIEMVFDKNSLDFEGENRNNLMMIEVDIKNGLSFPKAGKFTLSGVSGGYYYSKGGPSYWKLGATFHLFKAEKNIFLFEGHGEIAADMDFDSFGIGITRFITPIPGVGHLDWVWTEGEKAYGCLLMGKIRHDFPLPCPEIADCTDKIFDLKPTSSSKMFRGLGLGINSNVSLVSEETGEPYELSGMKVANILIGRKGVRIYGVSEHDKSGDVSAELFADYQLRFPQITKDWPFIPDDLKKGLPLGRTCLSFGYFEIIEEEKHLFTKDTETNLGTHFGAHAKAVVGKKEYPIFIPFDKLEDKDGDQLFFVTGMKVESTNYKPGKRSDSIGDTIADSFGVGENKPFVMVNLSSSDNELTITTPGGEIFTQDSPDSDTLQVDKSDGKYTIIHISDPEPGLYHLTYIHTGDERVTIFGENGKPAATLALNGSTVEYSLNDPENDTVEYSLALIDDEGNIALTLKEKTIADNGEQAYLDIGGITHLKAGKYKVALSYSDLNGPAQQLVSTETLSLQKSIPAPENIRTLVTNDFR